MEILGKEFNGPFGLDYLDIPESSGIYIITSDEDGVFNPIFIGSTVNLKKGIKEKLNSGKFSNILLESKLTKLYYGLFPGQSLQAIKKFEQLLIYKYYPAGNQVYQNEEHKDQSENKKNITKKFINWVAGITSGVALAITITIITGDILDNTKQDSVTHWTQRVAELLEKDQYLLSSVNDQKKELIEIKKELSNIKAIPKDVKWSIEAHKINDRLNTLELSLTNLENAITTDPIKALTIPMIKKDLDNIQQSFEKEIVLTRSEIDRVYEQNKWFIGLVVTISLSVLSMAVNNLTNRKN